MNIGKYLWLSGKFLKSSEGHASVMNHALHYGSGVFEGIRFYKTDQGPAIFRAQEHFERLHYSASFLDLKIPKSPQELIEITQELIRKNELESGYIRPVAFYGAGKMGLNPKGAQEELFIALWPWGKYLDENSISVGISPWIRIHPKSLQCDAKINGHYVNSIMSSLWAQKKDFQEALLLDYEGNIAEGPGENFFLIKNQDLITPPLGSILNGITRQTIIEVAEKEFGLRVREEKIKPSDIKEAQEAFFTGTAAEVTLIKSIDKKPVGNGKNFPKAQQTKDFYQRLVTGKEEKYKHWLTFV